MTTQQEIKSITKIYFNNFIISFILFIILNVVVLYFTNNLNTSLFYLGITVSFIITLYVSYAFLCNKLGFLISSDYVKTLEDAGIEIENITYKRSMFRLFKIDITYDLSKVTSSQRGVMIIKYPIDIPIDMTYQNNHIKSMKIIEKTFINNQNN